MSTLGSRIRTAREEKGMYQAQLAEIIGAKSAAVISNWEKDINKPDADKIVRICEALDISVAYLLDYYGPSPALTQDEAELLQLYRSMNSASRSAALATVRLMAGSPDAQKGKASSEMA